MTDGLTFCHAFATPRRPLAHRQLAAFADVEAWIQVACPRLSVDWGHFFDKVRDK
ncbi:conserved unknown protein [Ectocarpus siliculosus]|uniref:Uncharacterized protein n=1 Tax=Ectocarpus siliculosus TaxID=2880 RepID=D7FW64_ECTSI|nr:conserved unknown protein [Ectocarpus siliculosus]|eukprot:CBJ25584.1 conserved unknown protein [Ectocarpus siliculosus]